MDIELAQPSVEMSLGSSLDDSTDLMEQSINTSPLMDSNY